MPTVRISMVWEDAEGRQISTPVHFDSTDLTTLAIAQSTYTAYEALLQALSGAALVSAEVCFPLTATGAGSPTAGYNVRSGGWLGFQNSDGQGDGLYLPALLDAKMDQGKVISTDTDVAAFVTEAIGGGTVDPISTRGSGSLWGAFVRGYETVRKLSR